MNNATTRQGVFSGDWPLEHPHLSDLRTTRADAATLAGNAPGRTTGEGTSENKELS